jgi:hypothetical protein
VCRGVSFITPQTRKMKVFETFGWNRSDIELTKIFRGFAQAFGATSDFRSSRILPVQTALPPLLRVRPSYFSRPIISSLAAILMA